MTKKEKQIVALAKEVDQDTAYWNRLERFQEKLTTKWLKDNLEPILDANTKSTFAADVRSIFLMENLLPGDRLFMIYLMSQHNAGIEEIGLHDIMNGTGYSKKGVGDVMRRLIPMRMVVRTRKGFYQINQKKLF